MKFQWPLQRLLDVTDKRELAVKADLFDLSRRIAARQQEVARRREMLLSLLVEAGKLPLDERMMRQEVMMQSLQVEEARIRWVRQRIEELSDEREVTKEKLMHLRAKQDTLGKLRTKAKKNFNHLVTQREQQQADEIYHMNFARNRQANVLKIA